MTTRKQEIIVAAVGATVTTIVVAVAKLAWAVEPATFMAGVGTEAVVVYVILKNRELALLRRR
jgi:uncharacterized membrane protein